MIDSVLKGTGNSRFLKSAVPAGTSWADALAMLQAGTFPIDFNGINTEGFQQVGTPLNKANLLKDATAAQIGLPPSTTPDGMFQALGNTGELHVWRKTVVTTEPVPEVPGSYTLGSAQKRLIGTRTTSQTNIQSVINNISGSNDITVDLEGNVSLRNPSTFSVQIAPWNESSTIRNAFGDYKYIEFTDVTEGRYCDLGLPRNTIFLVNPNSTFIGAGYSSGEKSYIYDAQEVIGVPGHPYIPAGTTTTYPVSTNPNAYQEGDDAKAAGYTLGEVETGKFVLGTGMGSNAQNMFYISSSVTVDDSGNISQENQGSTYINGEDNNTMQGQANNVIGKFVVLNSKQSNSDFDVGTIWYIPPDATIGNSYSTDGEAYDQFNITNYVNKRQRVTGYAAIPAGTTIEYLGELGDKARVQVVSYVGTGTYGDNNPCSITAYFKIKVAIMMYHYVPSAGSLFMISDELSTNYTADIGFSEVNANYSWGKKSADGKTLSWYGTRSASGQFNNSGYKYYVLCIG